MTLADFIAAVEDTPIAAAMRGEDAAWVWAFPIVETFHVLSLSLVFGSILMVDLRLLGLTSRNSPVSALSAEVLPYTWTAFLLAAITGTLMFVSKAHTYLHNWAFQLKFLCIFLAGANMVIVNLGVLKRVEQWDRQLPPPTSARAAGALSILLWIGVIFFGRWIGFST